jgi:serine/threonine-protein kinase HipA
MADFEVHIDLDGRTRPIGIARSNRVRGAETILFEYDGAWLEDAGHFSLEPALALTRGTFAPPAGLATFGSIGDSAPDTWGRRLMRRAERRAAERESRAVRTLAESDYLLGVADETRLGALRFAGPASKRSKPRSTPACRRRSSLAGCYTSPSASCATRKRTKISR